MSKRIFSSSNFQLFLLLTLLLIIELLIYKSANQLFVSDYTFGLFFKISLNVVPLIFLCFREKLASLLTMLAIAAFVIPQYIVKTNHLIKLKEEASNIVSYVYTYKIDNNEFPINLLNYDFEYPQLKESFTYHNLKQKNLDDFELVYYIDSEDQPHWYKDSQGPKWMFYDP